MWRRALVRGALPPARATQKNKGGGGFQAASKKRTEDRGAAANREKLNQLYMQCMEPTPKPKPQLSPEELARGTQLARTYNARLWQRHKYLEKDLQRKLTLKWRAIHALPTDELRREAIRVDDPFCPLNRPLATETPPLRGFNWNADYDDDEDEWLPDLAGINDDEGDGDDPDAFLYADDDDDVIERPGA